MRKIALTTFFIVFLFFVSGCSFTNQVKRQYDKISGSPEVSSISPQDGASNVALDAKVDISFSTEMDESTMNAKGIIISYLDEGLVVFLNPFLNSQYKYDAPAKKLTITPAQKFIPGQKIKVTLTNAVMSSEGRQLPTGTDVRGDERYVFTFMTQPLLGEQDSAGEPQVESSAQNTDETQSSYFDALAAESLVKDFMLTQSETFKFDGRTETLSIEKITPVGCAGCFDVVMSFISKNEGFGDRSPEGLSSGETFHKGFIVIENGEIKKATLDEQWDMIGQAMLDDVIF